MARGSHQQPAARKSLENQQQRPISGRNLEQYAYTPQEESNKLHTPQLSSIQMAPRLFQRTNNAQSDQRQMLDPSANPNPAPPSSSSRFKPAPSFMGNHPRNPPAHRQTNMGPPPIPQRVRSERANPASNRNNGQIPDGPGSSRLPLLPPRSSQQVNVPATPLQSSSGARRFFPEAGLPISVQKPSQQSNAGLPISGGQRTPFVPQVQHGRRGGFG